MARRVSPSERLRRAKLRADAETEAYRREFEYRLTKRETDVLRLYAAGYKRSQIAAELGIQPGTVHGYARSARWMLGARTIPEAVGEATKRGLLGLDAGRDDRRDDRAT